MLRYLVARADENAHLAGGEPPPGFLGPDEMRVLGQLRVPARRRKWLLGRWVAKRLLRALLEEKQGLVPAWTDLVVENEASGAPYARLSGERLPWRLSISHREGLGFCAVVCDLNLSLGADLELVARREEALVHDFFTAAEAASVAELTGRERDLAVTIMWSAKESVLKALETGLRRDTRTIEICGLDLRNDAEAGSRGWQPVRVSLHGRADELASLRPWVVWRDQGSHVLTIALLPSAQPPDLWAHGSKEPRAARRVDASA